jgi:hypothetical protein
VKTLIACLRTPVLNIAAGALFGLLLAVVMRLVIHRIF